MAAVRVLRNTTPRGIVLGASFIVIGAVLLVLALDAHGRASAIGASNDPDLILQYNDLVGQRDLFTTLTIAAFFIGLFCLVMLTEKSLNSRIANDQMVSQARIAHKTLSGLNLKGNAVYVPISGALTMERVFIPSSSNGAKLPSSMTDDLSFSPGKDGSTPGALLPPSGKDLLSECEKESGVDFAGAGLEVLEADLQILRHGLGLMKDFHIRQEGDGIVVRVEYSGLREACERVRAEFPDTCRQMACFGCSCVLSGIAKATGKAWRVTSVDNATGRISFKLEPA